MCPSVAAEWFNGYFKQRVIVRYAAEGFPDDTIRNGPMVVSTASLQTVSGWFPGIDLEESRWRFRTPLEIDGVPAFWEDRLFNVHETDAVRFTIGDVTMDGVNPIRHFYHLGINTRVAASEQGKVLRVGEVVHCAL